MKDESFFKENTLDSRLIFDGRVLHLYKDTISLPNGGEGMREYCKHGGAVCVVPLTKDGEVVCVRQYRYALQRVTLEIPAGKQKIPSEKVEGLIECLAEDPRPSYQDEPERIYGMTFGVYNVKFRVEQDTLTVLSIE